MLITILLWNLESGQKQRQIHKIWIHIKTNRKWVYTMNKPEPVKAITETGPKKNKAELALMAIAETIEETFPTSSLFFLLLYSFRYF